MTRDESSTATLRLKVVEHYINVAITLTCGILAGMTVIADYPVFSDVMARAAAFAFWLVFGIVSLRASRESWLEIHGISSVAVEMDAVKEDWSNE